MRVLFFGYWGANEGLSQATINPHLEILCSDAQVDKVLYISIERHVIMQFSIPQHSKLEHLPYYSKGVNRFAEKLRDFILLPFKIWWTIRHYNVQLLICRSSLAGSIGIVIARLAGVPISIESFEPHALYMKELGIWKSWGLSYNVQFMLERMQKKYATFLLPVSNAYKNVLVLESKAKVWSMPCAVDLDKFQYSHYQRSRIRTELGITSEAIVGIYVGKFGGLYLENEATTLFIKAFDYYKDFVLIILGNQPLIQLRDLLYERGIQQSRVIQNQVSHKDVPHYLSAADFGFSLHRTTPSSNALSPIKNGEYWANGLPIVLGEKIGDDSAIVEKKGGGTVFRSVDEFEFENLNLMITSDRRDNVCVQIARDERSFENVTKIYHNILTSIT